MQLLDILQTNSITTNIFQQLLYKFILEFPNTEYVLNVRRRVRATHILKPEARKITQRKSRKYEGNKIY